MNRRDFFRNTTIIGTSIALVPSSVMYSQKAVQTAREVFEYTSNRINQINEYALSAILPSLASLAMYAYTLELFYTLLFFFLLIIVGIII